MDSSISFFKFYNMIYKKYDITKWQGRRLIKIKMTYDSETPVMFYDTINKKSTHFIFNSVTSSESIILKKKNVMFKYTYGR